MIRFKEYLSELFNNPMKGSQEYDPDPRNGLAYTYFFEIQDRKYYVHIHADIMKGEPRVFWVEFGYDGDRKKELSAKQKHELTNFNTDAIKIFSTVINRTDYYFTNPKHKLPSGDMISFTADEDKRIALYQKFAKYLCNKYDLTMNISKMGKTTLFELVKN
jgi:hypothetical protein